ncbi:hypothetical protein HN011_007960 [Eciton burchellii]|nr:hypothetical protein HN011_007960 [Eciton burchellii]
MANLDKGRKKWGGFSQDVIDRRIVHLCRRSTLRKLDNSRIDRKNNSNSESTQNIGHNVGGGNNPKKKMRNPNSCYTYPKKQRKHWPSKMEITDPPVVVHGNVREAYLCTLDITRARTCIEKSFL